jgi:hypothetical protein
MRITLKLLGDFKCQGKTVSNFIQVFVRGNFNTLSAQQLRKSVDTDDADDDDNCDKYMHYSLCQHYTKMPMTGSIGTPEVQPITCCIKCSLNIKRNACVLAYLLRKQRIFWSQRVQQALYYDAMAIAFPSEENVKWKTKSEMI